MADKLRKNHTILCTSRDYREVSELAKIRKSKLVFIGKHGGGKKSGKLSASINRMNLLFKKIQKFSPDLTISFCSPDASRISFGLGIKHIAFCNAPHAEAVMRLSIPLVQKLLIPWHIQKKEFTKYGISKKDLIQYHAMDEYMIVKGKKFSSTIPILKLKKKKTIIFRTYEIQASYVPTKIELIPNIKKIASEFSDCNFIVLGRYSSEIKSLKQSLGSQVIVLDKVVDSGEILSLCDVFIGSGGTMTSEAALRGIPTISYDAVPNLDEKYLVKKRMIKRAKNHQMIVKLTRYFLNSDRRKFRTRAKNLLNSMDDPFQKLVKEISV